MLPFEIRPVFNDDAGRLNIAHQLRIFANLNAFAGFHVSLNNAQRHHFAGFYPRVDLAVRTYGQFMIHQFDGAFDIAIHIEIFTAVNLAGDFDRLPDGG